jgi:hypothetical protein
MDCQVLLYRAPSRDWFVGKKIKVFSYCAGFSCAGVTSGMRFGAAGAGYWRQYRYLFPGTDMIEERFQKTESAVKDAENISADKKAELLGQLSKLKSAVGRVSETHQEDARSIARFAEASAREATRKKKKPALLKTALDGLKQSVEEFEASHPELVAAVNQYATFLAEIGI